MKQDSKQHHTSFLIGRGGQSEIYLGFDTASKKPIAIKQDIRKELGSSFEKELEIISGFDHPNIIKALSFSSSSSEDSSIQDAPSKFGLELSTLGSLFEYLYITKKSFPAPIVRYFAIQMLESLDEVHEKGFIHMDFKLDNLLLFDQGSILKLSDFGSSMKTKHSLKQKAKLIQGTDVYMAPEMIKLSEINEKVDVFSFGVTLFIMIVGCYPFKKASITDKDYKWLILKNTSKFQQLIKNKLPIELQEDESLLNILTSCWENDCDKRPTVSELKNFEWLNNGSIASKEEVVEYIQKTKKLVRRRFQDTISNAIHSKDHLALQELENKTEIDFFITLQKVLEEFDQYTDTLFLESTSYQLAQYKIPKTLSKYTIEKAYTHK